MNLDCSNLCPKLFVLAFSMAIVVGCSPSATSVESALQPQTSDTSINPNALVSENTGQSDNLISGVTGNQQNQSVAALNPQNSVAFLEMEGMPQTATTSLTQSLRTSIGTSGMTMAHTGQTGAKYRIRGYFSALNDGSGTLLVYVWDIFDESGARVHRINGQERSGNTSINPWQSITDEELSKVADRTAAQLSSWVNARKS